MSRGSPIRRLPRPLQIAAWIGAFGLALGGGVWYALSPSDWSWWIGGALGIPLVGLVLWRGEELRRRSDTPPMDGRDGPWAPP